MYDAAGAEKSSIQPRTHGIQTPQMSTPLVSTWLLALFLAAMAGYGATDRKPGETLPFAAKALVPVDSRIRGNEISVIELCGRYLDWQSEYFSGTHDGDGRHSFAQKIRSTPGKEDGLFWPEGGGSGESPSGPLFARAAFNEVQPDGGPVPYHGYFFKTLRTQVQAAAEGQDRRGFALAAWPAAYGVTGKRSFLVSHAGEIYWKDLGPDTPRAAAGMTFFNPDRSWTRVPPRDGE